MRYFQIALLSAVLMTSGGCLFRQSPQVQTPVAPPPAPIPAPQPQVQAPQTPVATIPAPTPTPPPVEPAKPSPFPPSNTPSNPPPTRAITPTPVRPPQTPAPALGVVLSAADKAKYENAYKADTGTANSLIANLSGKRLSAEQLDSLGRAKALLKQSAQYHAKDLTTSAELARRAKVLLQDLSAALK